jgi:septal ring factor EnvC (AmiA/AmiB activator)
LETQVGGINRWRKDVEDQLLQVGEINSWKKHVEAHLHDLETKFMECERKMYAFERKINEQQQSVLLPKGQKGDLYAIKGDAETGESGNTVTAAQNDGEKLLQAWKTNRRGTSWKNLMPGSEKRSEKDVETAGLVHALYTTLEESVKRLERELEALKAQQRDTKSAQKETQAICINLLPLVERLHQMVPTSKTASGADVESSVSLRFKSLEGSVKNIEGEMTALQKRCSQISVLEQACVAYKETFSNLHTELEEVKALQTATRARCIQLLPLLEGNDASTANK